VEILVKIVSFLNHCYKKAKQHKKFLILIGFVVVVVYATISAFYYFYDLIFVYPVNQVSQYNITNVTEKANLINQYRATSIQLVTTVAQILGGITVGIGIIFAWGNLITARDGQITERFTRAVDQLGNEKIEIILGGIYALERISNESRKDYWPIMEILTAYVRENSIIDSHSEYNSLRNVPISMDIQANESTKNEVPKIRTMSLDIQAILTVITRRKYSYKHGETKKLSFQGTNLQQTNLSEANLSWADLSGTNLLGLTLLRLTFLGLTFLEQTFLRLSFLGLNLGGLTFLRLTFLGLTLGGLTYLGLTLGGLTFLGLTFLGLTFLGLTLGGLTFLGLTFMRLTFLRLTFMRLTFLGLTFMRLTFLGLTFLRLSFLGLNFMGLNFLGLTFLRLSFLGLNFLGLTFLRLTFLGLTFLGLPF
jgi:hypothetical protein